MLATLDAPHLLILDEPTNHLDIESRESLVEALTDYTGAVIMVSHDMHLLSLVADRLWLVGGGRVAPFEGDLEDYRAMLLADDAPRRANGAKAGGSKPRSGPARPSRDALLEMRAEVRRCEVRVEKLQAMAETLSRKLADPSLYEGERLGEMQVWQRKYAEVSEALERAEGLWLRAEERLEAATA